ncbi:cyclase [Saccharopolyspora erythraea NRRL 2338]|uniref:Beta-lactamase-like n=2 Tax=Saccharopolyspora erythraea TaxID=1836 RepID=A4FGQ1_SACEN|nr:MBL fold metallo-hydrolase [Saccharopolyspora erythraea]EQD85629.1 beta-lactamase [Saccharopolyspora erythraea D]PFG96930.1 cyclase [Saccharopolyspora erythraea NRRL 2338]QRK87156.1 MBL fold metallo-hydrolase [Saccharopolyspora erythraea]CAM03226.1 beta-lactamase-like [Saccharopolyspora erythraea NRRL 2338]
MSAETVVTPLSAHTTAYLQPPGGWFRNNAGWFTGEDRVLLVDTCATERRSRWLLDAVERSAPGKPVSVVLTHGHGDHANGARLVAESGGAVMVSPETDRMVSSGPHTFPSAFVYSGWGDIQPPRDVEIVSQRTTFDAGGRTAEVIPLATTAHTGGDLVVWVPGDGVLFSGDLVFSGVTPLAVHGRISGWLDALRALEEFEARHLVPGHGPITAPAEAIGAVSEYLRWLLDSVTAVAQPDFAVLEREGRLRWPDWHDQERHAANLRVAHAEVHGRPVEIGPVMAAMIESAGGPIALDI